MSPSVEPAVGRASSRNVESPAAQSNAPNRISGSGRWPDISAENTAAKATPVTSSGCTTASGPNASATIWKNRATIVATSPSSHIGRASSSTISRGLSVGVTGTSWVARC
jgi:hypothetical protein